MKKLALICIAACSAMVALGAATASAAEIQTFPSYTGQTSTDSSTCGGDWANDTYTRQFKVFTHQNADGSYRVVENFKNGHFVTMQGTSPGACEAGPNNGHLVSAGVHGAFHGSYILTVNSGTFNSLATWDGTNGTAGFIAAAFGGSATYNTEDFYFYYSTGSPLACASTWTNASTGNGGDIATIC